MITVSHVTKKYGKTLALKDISFKLDNGSFTVLLGPNGAGKSTLMKAMSGILRYEGDIHVNGQLNKTPEARRNLGYVPELPAFYPNLTVGEHLEMLARAYKLTNYKDRIDMLLDRFELLDKKKKFGDELSKGMQQKLNLCLGLLPDPDHLLLDEPMIGLDPHAIKELKLILEEMRDQGKTVLVSTHIIDSVDMLWDRTIIMQKGEIRRDLLREELAKSGESLEDCFFEATEGIQRSDMTAETEREEAEKPDTEKAGTQKAGAERAETKKADKEEKAEKGEKS